MFFLYEYEYSYSRDIFCPININKGDTIFRFYLDTFNGSAFNSKEIVFDSGIRPAPVTVLDSFCIPGFSSYFLELGILYKDKKRR